MKISVFVFPLIIALAGFLWIGCASQHARKPAYVAPWGAEHVVTQPTPREDIYGAPPGSKLNWVKGYWANVNWRWIWVPGHWEESRPGGGAWVPGQWDHRAGQWRWQPGHWERE